MRTTVKQNRAESHDDFIHKIGIVEKEASESEYWLELLQKAHVGGAEDIGKLLRECRELIAIFTAIGKTAKRGARAQNRLTFEVEIRNPKFHFRLIRNSQFGIRN